MPKKTGAQKKRRHEMVFPRSLQSRNSGCEFLRVPKRTDWCFKEPPLDAQHRLETHPSQSLRAIPAQHKHSDPRLAWPPGLRISHRIWHGPGRHSHLGLSVSDRMWPTTDTQTPTCANLSGCADTPTSLTGLGYVRLSVSQTSNHRGKPSTCINMRKSDHGS